MDTTTQPILCCIGESVAGKPTQFIMEKAFAASGVDWRALTVEVEPDSMSAALKGIKAMQFMAARFFPSCQRQALEEFIPDDQVCRFVGGITSARRQDSRWEGWHNIGQGTIHQVSRYAHWDTTVCWLNGNSERTRSLLAAMLARRCKAVFWNGGPAELPEEILDEIAIQQPEVRLAINRVPLDETAEAISAAGDEGDALLIVADCPLGDLADAALRERCELLAKHFGQTIVSVNDSVHEAFSELLPTARLLRDSELAVLSEAYDFERWTSSPADFNVMRDAYDEYCDF